MHSGHSRGVPHGGSPRLLAVAGLQRRGGVCRAGQCTRARPASQLPACAGLGALTWARCHAAAAGVGGVGGDGGGQNAGSSAVG